MRIAGLLHDIGHAPFSHAGDDLFDPGVRNHEEMTRRLIKSPAIADILPKAGSERVTADEVAYAASGIGTPDSAAATIAKEIIGGELGVDRMDYLQRDSQMRGVNYGLFDLARLIDTLTLSEDADTGAVKLALEYGGLYAAEGLLTARYFMFSQVYFHNVRGAYDSHLGRFLGRHLSGGTLPTDLDAYMDLDDVSLIHQMRGEVDRDRDAHAIVNRDHFKLAHELRANEIEIDHRLPNTVADFVRSEFEDRAFFRSSQKDTVFLERGDITIVDATGNRKDEDILDASGTLKAFKPIWFARVYSDPEIRTNVRNSVKEFVSNQEALAKRETEDA